MGSKHKGLADLVHANIKQHRDGRRHVGKLYGKMAKAAAAAPVREAFEARHEALDAIVDATDSVFHALDRKPHDEACPVSEGHIAAVKRLIDAFEDSPARDAGLVAAAVSMERYATGQLSSLRLWAGQLGLVDALAALDRLRADAVRASESFVALAGEVDAVPASVAQPDALTPQRAALIGLR